MARFATEHKTKEGEVVMGSVQDGDAVTRERVDTGRARAQAAARQPASKRFRVRLFKD